jgi:hypothetical protein
MKRLLFVLVPMVVFAQVVVDTVIRLPSNLGQAFFIPELNHLYTIGTDLYDLDCSTYSLKAQIPISGGGSASWTHFSWNPRRHKLYVVFNPVESTFVIDVATDSVVRSLTVTREWFNDMYLSDIDVRFKPAVDTLLEYECAADTVIRRLPVHSTCASWDSVGRKLYVGQGSYKKLYVYDYLADSCLKVIDVSAIRAITPDACVFSRTYRRAYVSSFQPEPLTYDYVGIVDTDRDTLLRVLPVRVHDGLYYQAAVDERDGKVYITGDDGSYDTPDTMWVVDCATDSVLKKFECVHRGRPDLCIRWVPWSNRIYLVNSGPDGVHASSLVVIDCNTDSVIVPGMLVSNGFIQDIQLDPVHERIFVIGVDSNDVYVLRDTAYAAVETPKAEVPVASCLRVLMTSGGCDVQYSLASPSQVDLSVYNLTGREVRRLVGEEQSAGQHNAIWDWRDNNGSAVPSGVYSCRLTAGSESLAVAKVVVSR